MHKQERKRCISRVWDHPFCLDLLGVVHQELVEEETIGIKVNAVVTHSK